jgi:hypothetical protein
MASRHPHLMTMPELHTAKEKLGDVAAHYDGLKYNFEGFSAEELEPYEFRQQLQSMFKVTLSDEELGALVTYFDEDEGGTISLSEFMHEFFRLGKFRKEVRTYFNLQRRKQVDERVKKDKERILKMITPNNTITLPDKWTPEQEASALMKFTEIALKFEDSHIQVEVRDFTVSVSYATWSSECLCIVIIVKFHVLALNTDLQHLHVSCESNVSLFAGLSNL